MLVRPASRLPLVRPSLARGLSWLLLSVACDAEVERQEQHAVGAGASSTDAGSEASTSSTVTSASSGTAGEATGGAGPDCIPGDVERACWDCVDNDGDGWIDAWDTECISGFDDSEDSFDQQVPAEDCLGWCTYDCAFDGDCGSGNDGCAGPAECDPEIPVPWCAYDPAAQCEPLPPKCLTGLCSGAVVANGCDCLGCCDVTLSDGTQVTLFVPLPSCSEATLDEPGACTSCTQNPDCLNPCETCEYCLGKKQLPAECNGVADPCPGGEPACAPDVPCPPGQYCQTGCCIVPPDGP